VCLPFSKLSAMVNNVTKRQCAVHPAGQGDNSMLKRRFTTIADTRDLRINI